MFGAIRILPVYLGPYDVTRSPPSAVQQASVREANIAHWRFVSCCNRSTSPQVMDSIREESIEESEGSSSSSTDSPEDSTPAPLPAPVPAPALAPTDKRKRKASSKRKAAKRRRTDNAIARLTEQVTGMKDLINSWQHSSGYVPEYNPDYQSDVSGEVSGELYSDNDEVPSEAPCSIDFSLNTVLKEPSISKSLPAHVELLKTIQHFETDDWDNVRYAEVQKQYCSSPGFNFLETNDEFKPYEKSNSLALVERGFAAITQAVIKHNEASQAGFKSLIEWAESTRNLSSKTLKEKINNIFVKGSFQKTSSDTLQLACGHRAEIIQQRRDSVLRSIKDSYVKASLRKIPPSCENLFQKDVLSSAIEKAGGTAKVLWPPRASTQNKTAAQARQQQQVQALPSYANNYSNRIPSQGILNYPHFAYGANRLSPQGSMNNHNFCMQERDYPRRKGNLPKMPDPRIRGLTGIFKDTKHIPAQAEAMLDSQVNPFRACNPSANHDSNVFRAGQLTDFVTQWQHMQAPTPMIQIIQNFRIPFLARPPLQSNLFLTVCGTPKAASRTNIAGWVKKILLQAGIKASPGSVRPAVASKNWVQNCPLDEILARGNWRSENTFAKYYCREISSTMPTLSNQSITNLFTPIE
ncbi:Uncharacterized protein OBRU01_00690 [Operophtera brumata]|uniref:Uncharacterized protein n=1 Tax=Operophtera brumata TaxID=104452 RepID=A0A0L7LPZ2_OPEBR|nr:Uncharacterized protein OBRU01_00690 [Operophtera brumata]